MECFNIIPEDYKLPIENNQMSSNLYFLGTLHAGLTINNELELIIKQIDPDQILVEVAQVDIDQNNIDSYPPEMILAFTLSKENKIPVNGFDSKMNILKPNITEQDNRRLIERQKLIIGNRSWKDFNLSENARLLYESNNLINQDKWQLRQHKMVENIKKLASKNKRVLIITGCAHLDFFEHSFKDATFPLR